MPNPHVAMDEDSESLESEYSAYEHQPSEQEQIDLAAAKERAAHLFAKLKKYNSKEEVEAYSASRISALARGAWARSSVLMLKSWKADEQIARDYIWKNKMRLHKAKMMVKRHMDASKMPLRQWKNIQASIIQKGLVTAFRAKISKKHIVTMAGDTWMVTLD